MAYEDLWLLPRSTKTQELIDASVDNILNGKRENASASLNDLIQTNDETFENAIQAALQAS